MDKRSKMPKVEYEEDSQKPEVKERGVYVPTTLFAEFKRVLNDSFLHGTVYLVGPKGVGKSSLLRELHAYALKRRKGGGSYFDLETGTVPDSKAKELKSKFEHDVDHILFINNIHNLLKYPAIKDTLQYLLKRTRTKENWKMVVASSRQGLRLLVTGESPILSVDELNCVLCVNPEDSVASTIFNNWMGRKDAATTKAYADALEYAGYVPYHVKELAFRLKTVEEKNQDKVIRKWKEDQTTQIVRMLQVEETNCTQEEFEIGMRQLSIICTGPLTLTEQFWTATDVSWSCLKSQNDFAMEAVHTVTAVSPMVQDAVNDYVYDSRNTLREVVTCVKQLTRGQTGNLLGKLFEGMIRSEIKKNWRGIPYRYAQGEKDELDSLLVTGFEMKTVEGVSLACNIKANKAKKRVIYCPNADSFDFVIFDSDSKSHGLQVSV